MRISAASPATIAQEDLDPDLPAPLDELEQ